MRNRIPSINKMHLISKFTSIRCRLYIYVYREKNRLTQTNTKSNNSVNEFIFQESWHCQST